MIWEGYLTGSLVFRVLEKFRDLRWVPLEPEFIEYPNAQFLMIGEAQDSLGKAATAEGNKEPHEEEPGEELEKLEEENEHRVEELKGKILMIRTCVMLLIVSLTFIHRRSDHLPGFGFACEKICHTGDHLDRIVVILPSFCQMYQMYQMYQNQCPCEQSE